MSHKFTGRILSPAEDLRRHERMCCAPTLVYVHKHGYDKPVEAQIIDVSMTGLQLHLKESLPVGARITIDTGQSTVKGEVRHCSANPDFSFSAGVQVDDGRGTEDQGSGPV